MIEDKTLDILYKTMKNLSQEDRDTCLSFLVMNGFFGLEDDINYCAYDALYSPQHVLKKIGVKWKSKLEKSICKKETKAFSRNLQKFCDGAIVSHSVSSAISNLEQCAEKVNFSGDGHYQSYDLVFKGEVEQSLLLAEIPKEITKSLEWSEYHRQYAVMVKNFKVDTKFTFDNVLEVALNVEGISPKNYQSTYENVYHIGFDNDGNIFTTQRDRYDKLGRRMKCRG